MALAKSAGSWSDDRLVERLRRMRIRYDRLAVIQTHGTLWQQVHLLHSDASFLLLHRFVGVNV